MFFESGCARSGASSQTIATHTWRRICGDHVVRYSRILDAHMRGGSKPCFQSSNVNLRSLRRRLRIVPACYQPVILWQGPLDAECLTFHLRVEQRRTAALQAQSAKLWRVLSWMIDQVDGSARVTDASHPTMSQHATAPSTTQTIGRHVSYRFQWNLCSARRFRDSAFA